MKSIDEYFYYMYAFRGNYIDWIYVLESCILLSSFNDRLEKICLFVFLRYLFITKKLFHIYFSQR